MKLCKCAGFDCFFIKIESQWMRDTQQQTNGYEWLPESVGIERSENHLAMGLQQQQQQQFNNSQQQHSPKTKTKSMEITTTTKNPTEKVLAAFDGYISGCVCCVCVCVWKPMLANGIEHSIDAESQALNWSKTEAGVAIQEFSHEQEPAEGHFFLDSIFESLIFPKGIRLTEQQQLNDRLHFATSEIVNIHSSIMPINLAPCWCWLRHIRFENDHYRGDAFNVIEMGANLIISPPSTCVVVKCRRVERQK